MMITRSMLCYCSHKIWLKQGRCCLLYKFQFQMKTRHSIEAKGLLESKNMSCSRYNPESSTNITSYSINTTKTLQRSDSSSTLRRPPSDLSIIEDRYKTLQQNYRCLLEETRAKGEVFRQQKEQLQKYKKTHERDQKEIQQLRTLLEYARKSCSCTSIGIKEQNKGSGLRESKKSINLSGKDFKNLLSETAATSNSRVSVSRATGLKKNSRVKAEAEGKPPFSKYKFVPSVLLH